MKNSIFISYRRADLTKEQANLLHESLENQFGRDTVFLDDVDLHGGDKWRKVLEDAGKEAKICIVVMGPQWAGPKNGGSYRIQDETDVVRQEIEYAIDRKLILIPVKVHGAELFDAALLPDTLKTLYSNQVIKLDFKDWNTYKLKLIEAVHRHYVPQQNEKDKKITKILYITAAIIILGSLGIWRYPDINKKEKLAEPTPIEPTTSVEKATTSVEKECVDFKKPEKLNGLFFPVIGDDQKLEIAIANFFSFKCDTYKIETENKISEFHRGKSITNDEFKEIAKKCGADLYFGGQYIKPGNGHGNQFLASLGLVNDSINVVDASPKEFRLVQTNVSLGDITGGKIMDQLYENIIQILIGFITYQKKDFSTTIKILQNLGPEKIKNDSIRNTVYRIMADACYQSNKKDSALLYLEKTKLKHFSAGVELKKSLIATETKKYDKAIESYTRLIDSSTYDKSMLHEKRADQSMEIKDYKKAKDDYNQVKPKTEVQKNRVNNKIRNVDTKIASNTSSFTNTKLQQLSPRAKIELSDKLLQNGEASKAQEILKTIPATSTEFQKVAPLFLESQVKLNQVNVNTVPKEVAEKNLRLKVAMKVKQ